MRVLQIGLEWFPERGGGLDRYFHGLLSAAHSEPLDMRGLVAASAKASADSGGKVTGFASPDAVLPARLWQMRAAFDRVVEEFEPEIIASHFALHAFPILDRIDRPFVAHFHGPWAQEGIVQRNGKRQTASSIIQQFVESRVYHRADRMIVLSRAFANLLQETFNISGDKIAVIPGSIDVERFAGCDVATAEARSRLGWPIDRPVLLAVRRLVARMGLDRLIEAMKRPEIARHGLVLMIAGKGPLEGALAKRIAEEKLDDRIRLLGFVPDEELPVIYCAADCSIVPTQDLEGFGLVAAESLASGTPVLVTPVGGLPEVVSDLSPDLILAGKDDRDIADGIERWLNGELRLPTAEQCKHYCRKEFSWQTGVNRIQHEYLRLVR
ncbi:MAG: glycosyltransferase family 4 protein [Erythrobacter sp.]|nr:glycosyltransferase family 4 protein [Erythrobacter sp.]